MKPHEELLPLNNRHAREQEVEKKMTVAGHKVLLQANKTFPEEIQNVEEREHSCDQEQEEEENQQEEGRQGQKSTTAGFKEKVVTFLQQASVALLTKKNASEDEPILSGNHCSSVYLPTMANHHYHHHHQSLQRSSPHISTTAGKNNNIPPLPFSSITSLYCPSPSSDVITASHYVDSLNGRSTKKDVLHTKHVLESKKNEETKIEKHPSVTNTALLAVGTSSRDGTTSTPRSASSQQQQQQQQQGTLPTTRSCQLGENEKEERKVYTKSRRITTSRTLLSLEEKSLKIITASKEGSILTSASSSSSVSSTTSTKNASANFCPAVATTKMNNDHQSHTSCGTSTTLTSSSAPFPENQRKIAADSQQKEDHIVTTTYSPVSRRISSKNCQQCLDDIDCVTGLVFLDFDDGKNTFLNRYLSTPGVRVFEDHKSNNGKSNPKRGDKKILKKQKTRKLTSTTGARSSGHATTMEQADQKSTTLYKARGRYFDVSVNLGCHRSSAEAAAAVDIANILFWGGEIQKKPLYVLSLSEIEKGLKAAGVNDIKALSDVFRQKFTEEHKILFENYVENALCSIGGKDDDATDVLCCLEKFYDGKKDNRRSENMVEKGHNEDERCFKKRKKQGKNQLLFDGEHVVYEIDNDGSFSWRKSSEFI